MANYKHMRFDNSIGGFELWIEQFPPLERGHPIHLFREGDMYCSIEKVTPNILGKRSTSFAGIDYRRYDYTDSDFVYVPPAEGYQHFKDEVTRTLKKWGIPHK